MYRVDAEIDYAYTPEGRRIFRSSDRGFRILSNEIGVTELDKLLNKFSERANGSDRAALLRR